MRFESCAYKVTLSTERMRFKGGDSESIFRDSALLRVDSFFGFSLRNFWRFQANRDSGDCKGRCNKTAIKGGLSVPGEFAFVRDSFARVCLPLLAFAPLRLLAFSSVCLRLFAFAQHLLTPPFVA